jgi:cell wall-associated NlpC family hydrolase
MSPCSGCMKARRAIISKTPKFIRNPLERAFLPPEPAATQTPPLTLPLVTTPAEVIREARTWRGVPFRHQGRDRNGIDCIGLPIVILQALGALPPDFEATDYARFPHQNNLQQRLLKYCTPLPEVVPGCLVSLTWQRTLAHVAIYTDTDSIIHAYERAPHFRVIEHGFRGMWRTRFKPTAWALPGVRYG